LTTQSFKLAQNARSPRCNGSISHWRDFRRAVEQGELCRVVLPAVVLGEARAGSHVQQIPQRRPAVEGDFQRGDGNALRGCGQQRHQPDAHDENGHQDFDQADAATTVCGCGAYHALTSPNYGRPG
jgi:hypothetical protein